ncbi:MATE family efflux transporter [Rhodoferax sp.]|uniref:MATE family efflux transporter n=1 Tax=Rhodoferax sp. TaxID=50421 RepID=UPI00271BA447|nr:MATE family efflux transporter [Rhodoferax sp.]MDO9143651.1 MATE family efflux transporter [Rhodoferax sp.]MDP3865178.1 MATE family efflux transporter [Rhodoferax sp.]
MFSPFKQLIDHPAQRSRLDAELRGLWHLAWPILVGQLAYVGMAVVEVAMAGHASAQDLAGVSLGVSIWNMLIISMMGVMMAINPVVAHHVGAQDLTQVPHAVRQALWKGLFVGLVAMGLANLAALLFDHMTLEPYVHELAMGFVRITSVAMPLFACYRALYGYSTSINQTKPLMVIALLSLGLNIVVNSLLVFGTLGFPRLGGLGCAWATLISVAFNLLALLWWMQRSPVYRASWPFEHFEGPHWPQIKTLLKLGLPIGVTYFAEASAFSLIALLIAVFGSTQMAAHQIALNFTSLVFMVPLSLGLALLTRVGQSLGAGEPVLARYQAWVGVAVGLGFAVVSATLMALFSRQIASAYTSDAAVIALTAQLLLLAAVFQLSDSTQVVASCAIRGYKVTRAPMAIHLTAFWVFSLPLGYVLGLAPAWAPWAPAQPMAAQGFWIALVLGLTIAALGLTWLLRQVARSRI